MKRASNRRDFLKQTGAAAGAGFWILGSRTHLKGAPKKTSPNEKLNVACIGAGGRGSSHVNATAEQQNLVAMCDVDDARAAGNYKKFPKVKRFKDYRKMLDKIHKEIDAVFVATPDHNHAPASVMAMHLGKNVYCEKPLTRSIVEARVMAETAAKTGVVTQMGNQGHANRNARRGVEQIWAGAIGGVREAHCWTNRPIWPQGLDRPTDKMDIPKTLDWDLWLGPAPRRPYHKTYVPFAWRGWWDFGTGALGDMACHVMDLTFWGLKLGAPKSAEAVVASEFSHVHPESAPQWSVVRWEFPARGDMPPVNVTWYDGGKKPDPARVGLTKIPDNGSILIGDAGTMYVPHTYCNKTILLPHEQFRDYKGPTRSIPRARGHREEFFDACRGEGKTQSNFAYAGPMTESILLGVVALRTGRKVEWDAKNMKVTNYSKANDLVHYAYRKGWTL